MTDTAPDLSIPRKIGAMLRTMHEHRSKLETDLLNAESNPNPQPAPFDEAKAQIQIADANISDVLNGTDTATELAANIAIQRAASQKAVDAWQKQCSKEGDAQTRIAAELSALDTRIKATETAYRGELVRIAATRKQAARQAFDEAVEALFKVTAEYIHLEDLENCDDGRTLNYVNSYSHTAVVTAPFYFPWDTRNIDLTHEAIHQARQDFLNEIGVTTNE